MMHETGDKGDIGVAYVTASLIEQGFSVLMPVSSTSPFDLVAYKDDRFLKIQVKYRQAVNGVISAKLRRAGMSNGKVVYRKMRHDDCDILAFYCPDTSKCYYVPSSIVETGGITLRIEKAKNGQSKHVNFAADFTKIIPQ